MTEQTTSRIIVGKVGAPYGVKGWVRVASYTEPASNIMMYRPWQIQADRVWRTIEVADSTWRGEILTVRFAECNDREQAAGYRGAEVAIERAQLKPLPIKQYYWTDLIGLQVIHENGSLLGTVSHLLETGANDVLVVTGERERLIPWILDQVIIKVDLISKTIIVAWDMDF